MKVINLGILAHVDAGKTTLTECMLYQSGVIHEIGRVDNGTTITDSMELEKQRGMTIKSSTISFCWNNTKINLIDTPGHLDFVSEVENALHVLDGAVLVISAREGVQTHTRLLFIKLKELGIPVILYINKLDRLGVDFDQIIQDIRNQLADNIIIMQEYSGIGENDIRITNHGFYDEKLQEQVVCYSDELMNTYIEGKRITAVTCEKAFICMAQKSQIYAVLGGVSLKDRGTKEVLDLLIKVFISKIEETDKMSAYIYKIDRDDKGHKRCHFKVFSGKIKIRDNITLKNQNISFRVKNLYTFTHNRLVTVNHICAGDIGVIFDIKELKIGDVLGEGNIKTDKIRLVEPVLETCITPEKLSDRFNLLEAINEMVEEDSYLRYEICDGTNEIRLQLFGSLQKEIIKSFLVNRYGIKAQFSELSIVYKEQPLIKGIGSIRLREWGNPYNAGAVISVEPMPTGSGFIYENQVSFGYLEKPFQNAVLEGIHLGIAKGLERHEVIDVKVTFIDADYDSVLGTPADFRKLVPSVVHRALQASGIRLLEPWQSFTFIVPKEKDSIILHDIHKMKVVMTEYEYRNEETLFKGRALLKDIINYDSMLNDITSGKGILKQNFYGFLPMQ